MSTFEEIVSYSEENYQVYGSWNIMLCVFLETVLLYFALIPSNLCLLNFSVADSSSKALGWSASVSVVCYYVIIINPMYISSLWN